MKRFALAAVALSCAASSALAYDGDWKRGRVYYRGVCTACHIKTKPEGIPPINYTKAEWTSYLDADKHDGGKDTDSQYIAKAYRDSIKADNKAAAKFDDVVDSELGADVKAFVINGAKDGEAPATCN